MTHPRLWPADPACGRADAEFLPARKSVLRDRIRTGPPAGLAARSADRDASNIVPAYQRGLMTKLSAEAYAIVEGRHSDPFHYLGLHTEGDQTVVRAFLPEASKVEAIDEHGETAPLARIHDAGLFAGALPNGSQALPVARPLRRQRGRSRRSLPLSAGPDRLRSLSARRRHPSAALRQAWRASDDARRRRRRRLRGARAQCAAGQRGRRFQFLECAAPSDAGARHRLLGAVRAPRHAGRSLQVRYHRPAGPAFAAEVRSDGVCRGNAPEHRIDRARRDQAAASAPGARQASTR